MRNCINVEFLDTNVLVYAVSRQTGDSGKSAVARSLIRYQEQAISVQVLQEFYNVARNPKKLACTHDEAVVFCEGWKRFTVLEPTVALFDEALVLVKRFQISYYDAAILAAARKLKCSVVHSEDLNDGQDYLGVRVLNPFRGL